MRQATINKWIDIFDHHDPKMTITDYCKQIGVSRSAYYEKRRYFRKHPELAQHVQDDRDECDAALAMNNNNDDDDDDDEPSHTDQSCRNENNEDGSEDAPAIVPLMVIPEEMHSSGSAGLADCMNANDKTAFEPVIEISVGRIRLRCSTAIPEADLAKLVKVCASV